MAFGNNRIGKQKSVYFQQAGGAVIKFKHPLLAGQVSTDDLGIDEVDVSKSVKLDARYFTATPGMDSAKQVVMIDGSVITITNDCQHGTISMPVVSTSGYVSKGDLQAALNFVRSMGDSIGGVLTVSRRIGGTTLSNIYYGVTIQNMEQLILAGNDVPEYNVVLTYAGWFQASSDKADVNALKAWAVGGDKGIEAHFAPLPVNEGSIGSAPLTAANSSGIPSSVGPDDNKTGIVPSKDSEGFTKATYITGVNQFDKAPGA